MTLPPLQHRRVAGYDFATALNTLQEKIQALSAAKDQATIPASRLGAAWTFLKANKGNILLLMTFYSMSTASMLGTTMTDQKLKSDQQHAVQEQDLLQDRMERLKQQVQQQQTVLDDIAADLQQLKTSSFGWLRQGRVQQQLLQRLQVWKEGQQGGCDDSSSSSSSSSTARIQSRQDSQQQQQQQARHQQESGVRIGPLGKGFLI